MLRLSGGERTDSAPRRGQLRGAFEERRRRGDAAAAARAPSRTLELGGDVLVRLVGRVGAVPSVAIRIDFGIGRPSEGPVRVLALLR
jgi:hypothetical protein